MQEGWCHKEVSTLLVVSHWLGQRSPLGLKLLGERLLGNKGSAVSLRHHPGTVNQRGKRSFLTVERSECASLDVVSKRASQVVGTRTLCALWCSREPSHIPGVLLSKLTQYLPEETNGSKNGDPPDPMS